MLVKGAPGLNELNLLKKNILDNILEICHSVYAAMGSIPLSLNVLHILQWFTSSKKTIDKIPREATFKNMD